MRHDLLLITLALLAVPRLALGQQPTATPQASPSPSPTPFEAPTSGIVLLSIVPKAIPVICTIGSNNVLLDGTGGDLVGPGSTSGLAMWHPAKKPLRAQAEGYAPGLLKPFLKPGETPIVLLTENPSGTLAFEVIPNTMNREGGFYDAINLTAAPSLQITVDGKPVALPRGKRIRVSTEKQLTYSIPNGGQGTLGTDNPAHRLLVFHQDAQGKTVCTAMPDILLQ